MVESIKLFQGKIVEYVRSTIHQKYSVPNSPCLWKFGYQKKKLAC